MGASCVSSTRAKFHHPRLPSGRWIPPITTTTRPIEPSQINWTPPSTRNQGLRHPMKAVPSSRKQRPHLSRGKFYGGRRIKRPPVSANNTPKYATKSCGSVCHAFKSDALSSQRTRAGAIAHQVQSASLQFNPRRNRNHRNNAKFQKLHSDLMHAVVPSAYAHLCWSYEKLDNFTLVFDGGNHDTPELQEPPPSPPIKKSAKSAPTSKKHHTTLSKHRLWKSLRISRGDLHVADTIDPSKGITYPNLDGKSPFVRVPRRASLEITQMESMEESNKFCIALKYGFNCQRGSLHRGEARKIYCDHKYCCMGVQPNRAAPGVNDATYHRDSMPEGMWDLIVEKMKLTENALSSYVSTDAIRDLNCARRLLKFKTMSPHNGCRGHSTKIFGGIAFGVNVHLSSHIDLDYTYSVTSVHLLNHQYSMQDKIVAYFCFPRLGLAVALRPGDLLLFNPSEPHAISSRVEYDDTLFCVSMYLKTAVVGLNDNSIDLTTEQKELLDEYNKNNLTFIIFTLFKMNLL